MEEKKGLWQSQPASLLLWQTEGVALQALTQLHPELSPTTSTHFSLMLPTGADALMLLAPPQAIISRQAGKAKK